MTSSGHETHHLRVSPFRASLLKSLKSLAPEAADAEADRRLYRIGNLVLRAAWHDDQRLAMSAAQHFRLPAFQQAIELVYLCLSGDLSELRVAAAEPAVTEFFRKVYPQPAIATLLDRLPELPGVGPHLQGLGHGARPAPPQPRGPHESGQGCDCEPGRPARRLRLG